jgi:acyl carrier protein
MDTISRLRRILRDALQIGARAEQLQAESRLIDSVPEFDSMAAVTVLTMIEEEFDITVEDDEVSAALFETLGSLTAYVESKG